MKMTILDYSTSAFDSDSKFILYDDKKVGILIYDKPLNDKIRDLVYQFFRNLNLDPFKVSFISERAYYENYRLYERS